MVASSAAALGSQALMVIACGVSQPKKGLLEQASAGGRLLEFGLVLRLHMPTAGLVTASMHGHLVAVDQDLQPFWVQQHGAGLPDELGPRGHTVAVAVHPYAPVSGHHAPNRLARFRSRRWQ